ncbi:uncharacterized protein LOC100838914 isoform X2 [Brachypodium distachyon]|uniref:uncharacterized protein LOC100838914 isoform X2 n=1 Tax=Brachypodium distachyon TaxID=15368 RepID=UPI00071CBAAE|nr:uncharacterized protein LOC100838914 isoform X2 [Brachypodium distachyon]|eukprot:XP_014756975.1 uncharacterized protein LOC100838914 isoform X2 [Brachypodium distachyon]
MAPEPQPGPSRHGTTIQAPPPASVDAPIYRATIQKCVALLDWWLVRGQDDKIRVAGYTERNRAARVFTSDFITMGHADGTLETADHKIVLTRGPLNIKQMHRNGFPYEVSKHFQLGFPAQWEKYANSNMKQSKHQAQSPSKSIDNIWKFLSFMKYNFEETDFNSSKGSTGNTDGTPIQGLSNLSNGTPRFQDSSGPGPGETCSSAQGDNQHQDMHLDADAGQVPAKGMSPEFGVVQGSEDSTGRRLRSGKVYGMSTSSSASLKRGRSKRKTIQHDTPNRKILNEETILPVDPTNHGNGGSPVTRSIAAAKLQSPHPFQKGM